MFLLCALNLLPCYRADAAENILLSAMGSPNSQQVLAAAVSEPGSPVVGKSYSITNDLHLTVGYRLWLNFWQTSIAKISTTIVDPDIPTDIIPITSRGSPPTIDQFAPASVPTMGVRYKNFFASASGMISSNYDFSKATEFVQGPAAVFGGIHTFRLEHHVNARRYEADVNLGYYIHPWIALTMGYKGVFQQFDDKVTEFDVTHGPIAVCNPGSNFCLQTRNKSSTSYNGGTIGIAANVPIPEGGLIPTGFSIYGNGAGGGMAVTGFQSALYGTMDAGIAYKPTSLPLLFTLGYKFQIIRTKANSQASEDHFTDYTRGGILGINFIF
jgi:hypothetical protein